MVDVFRERIEAVDAEGHVIKFLTKHQGEGFRGIYIEPKGHGIYLNQALPRKRYLVPNQETLDKFYSDRHIDKIERANNATPHLSHRKVHMNPAIANVKDLVAEALQFPLAKHDDFVDTVIDGVKYVYARKLSILDVI